MALEAWEPAYTAVASDVVPTVVINPTDWLLVCTARVSDLETPKLEESVWLGDSVEFAFESEELVEGSEGMGGLLEELLGPDGRGSGTGGVLDEELEDEEELTGAVNERFTAVIEIT